jgi:hypothetical protein
MFTDDLLTSDVLSFSHIEVDCFSTSPNSFPWLELSPPLVIFCIHSVISVFPVNHVLIAVAISLSSALVFDVAIKL